MRITTRTKELLDAASSASKPVWALLTVEAAMAVGLITAGVLLTRGVVQNVAFDRLPPWRALGVLPVLGAAAALIRAAHPVIAARRWHGVLVRRIDEHWGDER
jgi:predicted ABC-type sugar transport system permease subunit